MKFDMTENEKSVAIAGGTVAVSGAINWGIWSCIGAGAVKGGLLAGYAGISVIAGKAMVAGGVGVMGYAFGKAFVRGYKESRELDCDCPCDPIHPGCSVCKIVK